MVRYGRHGTTPEAIDLADRTARAREIASTPFTAFVLALNGILDALGAPLSERLLVHAVTGYDIGEEVFARRR